MIKIIEEIYLKEILESIKIELFENMELYIIDNNTYDDGEEYPLDPELNLEAIYNLLDEKLGNLK